MAQSSTVVSVLALGVAGFAAYAALGAARPERPDGDALAALEARLDALDARLAAAAPAAPAPVVLPPSGRDGDLAAAPKASRDAAAPAPLEARVAELAKRLEDVEARAKEARAPVGLYRTGLRGGGVGVTQGLLTSLDDATTQLGLTGAQRAEWERVLADSKRDLDDLHALRDDDGKSWKDHNDEALRGLTEGGRIDLGKMLALRTRKVPGRDETYGQAEGRIRTEAKRRLRDALGADQQQKFDESVVDPLLGGAGGGPVSFAFTTLGDAPKPADK